VVALAVVQVSGDGTGNVEVTFNQAVLAAAVTPSGMTIDIDTGDDGTQIQVSANVVGFHCGSSFVGATWVTDGTFVAGLAPAAGVLV
jgi:hypothetical protein